MTTMNDVLEHFESSILATKAVEPLTTQAYANNDKLVINRFADLKSYCDTIFADLNDQRNIQFSSVSESVRENTRNKSIVSINNILFEYRSFLKFSIAHGSNEVKDKAKIVKERFDAILVQNKYFTVVN